MSERRVASLDALRGLAAFSVAIPHFFMAVHIHERLAENLSILGVEIFFVLSGFVLAPQIIGIIIDRPSLSNLYIFWVRRWMRTIPAYLVALTMITVMSRHLLSADFLRYATYTQNLFYQSNVEDYFPIAWSLSIEEWFYLIFPLFLAAVASMIGRRAASAWIGGLLFVALITVLRTVFGDTQHWGEDVRRVVAFRMDAIGWGFLFNLVWTRTKRLDGISIAASASVLTACGVGAIWATSVLSNGHGQLLEALFPFYASAFGAAAILLSLKLSKTVETRPVFDEAGYFLGRISYSVYLFHLVALEALVRLSGLSWPFSLAIFIAVTMLVAWLIYTAIEAPILSLRPRFHQS
jgi:peptidoglycan/LPS O-acetylase OafA/YrhL